MVNQVPLLQKDMSIKPALKNKKLPMKQRMIIVLYSKLLTLLKDVIGKLSLKKTLFLLHSH